MNHPQPDGTPPPAAADSSRRAVLGWLGLGVSLAAAYGTFASFLGRFLYPAKPEERGWLFVTEASALETGGAVVFETPSGARVNVTRRGPGSGADDFQALGSTCPHLGCQVHWEPQNNRFFCPCHNGIFEPGGKAIGGPPGEAGLSLPKFPVKVESGLLFMEVPLAQLAAGGAGRVIGRVPAAPRLAVLAPSRCAGPDCPGFATCQREGRA